MTTVQVIQTRSTRASAAAVWRIQIVTAMAQQIATMDVLMIRTRLNLASVAAVSKIQTPMRMEQLIAMTHFQMIRTNGPIQMVMASATTAIRVRIGPEIALPMVIRCMSYRVM